MDILEQLESGVSSIEEGSFEGSSGDSIFGTTSVPVVTSDEGEEPAASPEEVPAAPTGGETAAPEETGPALPSPETRRSEMEAVTEDPLSSPAPAPAPAEAAPAPAPAEAAAPEEAAEQAAEPGFDMAQAHTAVQNAKQAFLDSRRKTGLIRRSDDANTVSVKEAIRGLNDLLTKTVPTADADYAFGIESICQAYARLIKSCNDYATFINGKEKPNSTDLTRLDLSRQILTQSEKELSSFNIIKGQYIEGKRTAGENWTDILYNVRAEDLNRNELETQGAGSSTLYIKTNEDGSKRFIKPEERTARDESIAARLEIFAQSSSDAMAFYERLNTLAPDNREFIYGKLEDLRAESEQISSKGYKEDEVRSQILASVTHPWFKHFKDDLIVDLGIFLFKKNNEYSTSMDAGIKAGSIISDRNVSSSRVAETLGMGDMIAKSETVLMHNEEGRLTRANSMEGVSGVKIGDLVNKVQSNGDSLTLTPEAAKQLFQLQIFDLITGQVDRNGGNYMVEYEFELTDENKSTAAPAANPMAELIGPEVNQKKMRYRVLSVKGIDNDMAFGTSDVNQLTRVSRHLQGLTAGNLVSIPYLPQDFYDRIMSPDIGSMLQFGQMDLRNEDEIKALLGRFEQVKQTLKILVNAGKLQIIADEGEWERTINEHIDELRDRERYARSYASGVLL